jgi:hypothetical protein
MKAKPARLASVLAVIAWHPAAAETWVPYLQEWLGQSGDHMGRSIAIDGDASGVRFVYVGVPDAADGDKAGAGRVDVWQPSAQGVSFVGPIFATLPQAGAHFGASLAARDRQLVVGAPDYNDAGGAGAGAGYAELFHNDFAGTVVSRAAITGNGGNFGSAVAVSATFAAISSVNAGGGNGCVFTYQYTAQTQKWATYPADASSCGSGGEKLGASVAIFESGPTSFLMAAGAPAATQGANALAGAAHVYFPNNGAMLEIGTLAAQDPAFLDVFGTSIGIDANHVYVGATGRDNGAGRTGSVSIFKPAFLIGYDFVDEYFPLPPTTIGGHCGASLGVDPVKSGFVLGCPDSDGLVAGEGTARVYRPYEFLGTTVWLEDLLTFGSQPHHADKLGSSVALFGDYAAVGAPDAFVSGQSGDGGFKEFRPNEIFGNGFEGQ